MGFPNLTSRLGRLHVSDSGACSTQGLATVLSGTALAVSESSSPPSLWLLAATVLGLPTALWTYKCLMMVLFQRKIIYMGGVPLGSRAERLDNRDPSLDVKEITLASKDGMSLSGIIVSRTRATRKSVPPLVIMYLQGNAGNPPHRIPVFRLLVNLLDDRPDIDVFVVAVAPRSYWKSTNKAPSEYGFMADYGAALDWISSSYPGSPIVLYGHSIGGSVAIRLLDSLDASPTSSPRVKGLIIENAFTSVPDMVRSLYPSRWLPYYYLGPLVWDKWDALAALCRLNGPPQTPQSSGVSALERVVISPASILILNSSDDEVVPPQMGEQLLDAASTMCATSKYRPERVVIPSALHDDAYTKRQWKDAMRGYLHKVLCHRL
ncbi:hypothetical protein FRC08_000633 [Ceratobasidium sp. 394]|nr:hypothetical protein FRC08_000633 [Ceratobasidium sp. 394]